MRDERRLRLIIRERAERGEGINEIFGWIRKTWRGMTTPDWEIVNRAAREGAPGFRTLTSAQWRAIPRDERDHLAASAHDWFNNPGTYDPARVQMRGSPSRSEGSGRDSSPRAPGGGSRSSGGGYGGGGGGGYGYYDPYDPYGYGYGYGYGGGARSSSPSKEKEEREEGDGDKGDASDAPLYEIFGWSQKEKDAAAALKDAEDRKRDEDFDRESIQNEKDWGRHKDFRTEVGRKEIAALKRKIGMSKLMGILGPDAERDTGGNPQMFHLSEGELVLVDRIFKIGSSLNYPWNVNPLGIKVATFVPYVSHYMDLWRRGVPEPQRTSAAGRAYASTARARKEDPTQGMTTHPGGSAKSRRGNSRNWGR